MKSITSDETVELINYALTDAETNTVFEKTIVYNLEKRYPEYCRMLIKDAMMFNNITDQVSKTSAQIESQLRDDVTHMDDPLLKNLLLNVFTMTNFKTVAMAILDRAKESSPPRL